MSEARILSVEEMLAIFQEAHRHRGDATEETKTIAVNTTTGVVTLGGIERGIIGKADMQTAMRRMQAEFTELPRSDQHSLAKEWLPGDLVKRLS